MSSDIMRAVTSPTAASTNWIDELPDGLLVCHASGEIAVANRRMAQMAGYATGADLVGTVLEDLVPERSRSGHAALRNGFLSANTTRPMGPGLHLTMQRRDGTELPVEISLAPLPDGSGTVAVVRDVTERLRAEALLRATGDLLSLADERERIARDLHDTVLQHLFGLGLELQAAGMRAPAQIAERIEGAVDEIDRIIREIRTAVFTLGSAAREGSLGQELNALMMQSKRVLGFAPRLRLDGPVESSLSPQARVEMIASLREALTNVARHAAATEAEIEIHAGDILTVRVLDNGRGVDDPAAVSAGNGLRNLAERARLLGGGCSIAGRPDRGTELRWWVPLPDDPVAAGSTP